MRVLYCTDTYLPQINGVSIVTERSVDGLRCRGWQCSVVAPRYPSEAAPKGAASASAPVDLSLPSAAIPMYPEVRIARPDVHDVVEHAARFRPDIVHCATEFVVGRLGEVAANRLGVPFVTSYHTDFGRYTAAYGVPWLAGPVRRYLARFHSRAARTYTPSAVSATELRRMGIDHVEVWGRTIDTALFHPGRRSHTLRDTCNVGDRTVFLHVGRLAAEKGVDRILDAFRIARDLLPHNRILLIIAGEGPERARLVDEAPPDVLFLGNLDRERDLPRLYASCDAFVFASLTETLGLVILEAMASGLPVIAAPAGGVADHLRDGQNGLAYPPADSTAMARAMVRLAMEPALRRQLGAAARLTATALDWEAELDRLDISYREVCHRDAGKSARWRLAG